MKQPSSDVVIDVVTKLKLGTSPGIERSRGINFKESMEGREMKAGLVSISCEMSRREQAILSGLFARKYVGIYLNMGSVSFATRVSRNWN